jgi:hypothetical protein
MAFVAGYAMSLSAGVKTALPAMVDLSGNSGNTGMYAFARFPGGTTYTWDVGNAETIVASTDTVVPIPPGALYVTATGASSVQLGKVM